MPVLNAQDHRTEVEKLLPEGAKVIETADVTSIAQRPRIIALWMVHPAKRDGGEEYCGTAVEGDRYFEGPTRLSLVDPTARRLINTIKILGRGTYGVGTADNLKVPLHVGDDYYLVPHPNAQKKGVPEILHLGDFTGEGKAAQFVLFRYEACGIASGSVLGYSSRSDRAVQYPIEVHDENGTSVELWVMQVFSTRPIGPGRWEFRWNIGHGLDETYAEDVSFDLPRQLFVERRTTFRPEPSVK